MAIRVIDGIRYREEDVERLQPVLSKALRPGKAAAETTGAAPRKRRASVKKSAPVKQEKAVGEKATGSEESATE